MALQNATPPLQLARRTTISSLLRAARDVLIELNLVFGLRVFSATRARDRAVLGETITRWIADHPEYEMIDKIVLQSSDAEFHCLSIVVFFQTRRDPQEPA